MPYGYNILVKN